MEKWTVFVILKVQERSSNAITKGFVIISRNNPDFFFLILPMRILLGIFKCVKDKHVTKEASQVGHVFYSCKRQESQTEINRIKGKR